MNRIKQMLDSFHSGRSLTASDLMESNPFKKGFNSRLASAEDEQKKAPTPLKDGAYLNCVKPQRNADVNNGVASRSGASGLVVAERSDAVVEGGEAAERDAQVPSQVRATPHRQEELSVGAGGIEVLGWAPPPPPLSLGSRENAKEGWFRSSLFCELWAEGIQRGGYADVCRPSKADRKSAFEFFYRVRQAQPFFTIAVAMCAWRVADDKPKKFDRFFNCRSSYELQSFLRLHESGKLMPEIGQFGITVNAYVMLRCFFTDSELRWFGWKQIPIVHMPSGDLWENDQSARNFYTQRYLLLPPEFTTAASL
jgi:hypothetical protein